MKTSYRLIPWNERPRIWDTIEEARSAASVLRKQNKGFFLYEVTMEQNRKQMRLVTAWNGLAKGERYV